MEFDFLLKLMTDWTLDLFSCAKLPTFVCVLVATTTTSYIYVPVGCLV